MQKEIEKNVGGVVAKIMKATNRGSTSHTLKMNHSLRSLFMVKNSANTRGDNNAVALFSFSDLQFVNSEFPLILEFLKNIVVIELDDSGCAPSVANGLFVGPHFCFITPLSSHSVFR
jgi:hypothetical protein